MRKKRKKHGKGRRRKWKKGGGFRGNVRGGLNGIMGVAEDEEQE